MAKATLEQVTELLEQIKHERLTGERLQALLTESKRSPAERLINSFVKRAHTIIYEMDETIMQDDMMEELAGTYAQMDNMQLAEKVACGLRGIGQARAYACIIESLCKKGCIEQARALLSPSSLKGSEYPDATMRALAAITAASKNNDDFAACKNFYETHLPRKDYLPYLIKACVACNDFAYCQIEIAKIPVKTPLRDQLLLIYIKELVKRESINTADQYSNDIFSACLRIKAYIAIAAVTNMSADFRKIRFYIGEYIRVELHDLRAEMYAMLAKASRDTTDIAASMYEITQVPFALQGESLCHLAEACVWVDDIEQARKLARQIGDEEWRARAHLAVAHALMEQPSNQI